MVANAISSILQALVLLVSSTRNVINHNINHVCSDEVSLSRYRHEQWSSGSGERIDSCSHGSHVWKRQGHCLIRHPVQAHSS